jgi:hypothetical protein
MTMWNDDGFAVLTRVDRWSGQPHHGRQSAGDMGDTHANTSAQFRGKARTS